MALPRTSPTSRCPVFVPVAPFISDKTIGKTADALYRQHEAASEQAVENIAAVTGEDERAVRLSDMRDRLREGDIAASLPTHTPVHDALAKGGGGFQAPGNAPTIQYPGTFPRAGDSARRDLVSKHQDVARRIERAGRIATYR